MMTGKRRLGSWLAVFALLAFLPQNVHAEELQAALVGTEVQPDATGLARYRNQGSRGRGLEVIVEGVDLTDTVWVIINGNIVAQIAIIGTRGGGGIETRRGDQVPDIQVGDVIEIADENGTILLRGMF